MTLLQRVLRLLLDKALIQYKPMSNLEFENQGAGGGFRSGSTSMGSETSGMVKWLINKGLVKDGKSGNLVLLGIAGLFLVLAILTFSYFILGIGNKKNIRETANPLENIPQDKLENISPQVINQINRPPRR
jgi:hypothetical protein